MQDLIRVIDHLVPIFGIVFGCAAVIGVAAVRYYGKLKITGRGVRTGDGKMIAQTPGSPDSIAAKRIAALEKRVISQNTEIGRLKEENRFLNQLVDDTQDKRRSADAGLVDEILLEKLR